MRNSIIGRALFCACAITLFSATNVSAQQILVPGERYEILPSDTQCFTHTRGKGMAVLPMIEATCNNNTGRADIKAATNGSLRKLNMETYVRFQKWIEIEPVAGATEQSLLPVQIRIPKIEWNLRLFNDVVLEFFGRASANILVTVRENPISRDPTIGNASERGSIIDRKYVLAASHGGIGAGCVFSSLAGIASGSFGPAAKCVAAAAMKLKQKSSVSINTLLRPGQIYNIEIELQGFASKRINPPQNPNYVSVRTTPVLNPPSMKWSKMVISIENDPQRIVAGLQAQIDNLQEQIDALLYALENHSHDYLTGKGSGHNNTIEETSAPSFQP